MKIKHSRNEEESFSFHLNLLIEISIRLIKKKTNWN